MLYVFILLFIQESILFRIISTLVITAFLFYLSILDFNKVNNKIVNGDKIHVSGIQYVCSRTIYQQLVDKLVLEELGNE